VIARHTRLVTLTPIRSGYGADPAQFGELYRPERQHPLGTVVVIHGGFWRARYDLALGAPLARDLAERGYVVWNLEYRRVGNGGGWPSTLVDVAAGIDHLASLDVDTSAVVGIGHSAGGHLATWAAGRGRLAADDPGTDPVVEVTAVISQAGVLDLVTAAENRVGASAVTDLIGASTAAHPQRWRIADPIAQVPVPATIVCLHAPGDEEVPIAQSVSYVAAATAAGGDARLVVTTGDHYTLIDVGSDDWAVTTQVLSGLVSARR
jgi:acetyl esterase/lipase